MGFGAGIELSLASGEGVRLSSLFNECVRRLRDSEADAVRSIGPMGGDTSGDGARVAYNDDVMPMPMPCNDPKPGLLNGSPSPKFGTLMPMTPGVFAPPAQKSLE